MREKCSVVATLSIENQQDANHFYENDAPWEHASSSRIFIGVLCDPWILFPRATGTIVADWNVVSTMVPCLRDNATILVEAKFASREASGCEFYFTLTCLKIFVFSRLHWMRAWKRGWYGFEPPSITCSIQSNRVAPRWLSIVSYPTRVRGIIVKNTSFCELSNNCRLRMHARAQN